jgi:hypothetical protein
VVFQPRFQPCRCQSGSELRIIAGLHLAQGVIGGGGVGYRFGVGRTDFFVDESGVEVITSIECNRCGLPSAYADALSRPHIFVCASCCSAVSEELCLVMNGSLLGSFLIWIFAVAPIISIWLNVREN